MPSPTDAIRVLFIGGASRTGSTLLSLLLGSLPGHFAAGELRYVWLRGLLGDQLCGCGATFRACPFWRGVLKASLGPVESLDARHYASLWQRAATPVPVVRAMFGVASQETLRARREYLNVLRRMFEGLHEVSGGKVIVDSSKYASDCELLALVPGISVHAVHLVRDSRGVAYSWRRRKLRPEIHWRHQEMSLFSPWRTSFDWSSMNVAMEVVGKDVDRYDRIRYEDLVCDPVATLADVLPGDMRAEVAEVLAGGHLRGAASHTVAGNPLRLERGPLTIRPDVEWTSEMDATQRRLVTALTWPLLLRYGYRLTPEHQPGAGP